VGTNKKVYLHEFIDIILHNRGNYFEHMTTGWKKGQAELNQRTFGIWGTFGTTGRWPEVVNLWEYDSLEHMAADYKHETSGKNMQNPTLYEWWAKAQTMRSGGFDRILLPTDYSMGIEEICRKGLIKDRVYYQQRISVKPGMADTYLDLLGDEWMPVAQQDFEMRLLGAYKTAMRNDSEVFVFWGIKTWEAWAAFERAVRTSDKVKAWEARTSGIALDWINTCLCNAPQSPLETGHAP
jgi:hypothetical protein